MATNQAIEQKELFQMLKAEQQPHIAISATPAGGKNVDVEIAWTTPMVSSSLKVLYFVGHFVDISDQLDVDEKAMKAYGNVDVDAVGTVMFHAVGLFQLTQPVELKRRLTASAACYIA